MADVANIRRCLKAFDFETMFIEVLGWDRHHAHLEVELDDAKFSLDAIAEKRGFQVFLCHIPEGQAFPASAVCNRIQRQVAKTAHENLIVFVDETESKQSWRWGKREKGRLLRSRGADYHKGQSGEALAQRLSLLAIELEEEEQEGFSLVEVTQRVRAAFDVDRVTRQFYNRFRDEHQAFLSFIKGITAAGDQEWYASLMLNRLMFVYFIQKKGFLDGDLDYLQNRLQQTKNLKGKDKFHSFYRYFLLRLFHEGFGQRETDRSADLEALIGTVPYLNGGLFDVHELEHDNPNIQIADAAFERLFAFFDQYQWHLDDRPLRNDTEINPDVLGYIFEKYINQKQMGAYYTKEDITDYISKNTIIPYLFDAAAKRCPVGLQTGAAAWQLLADDPDRYIYDAVGHGIFVNIHTGERLDAPVPLPPEIAAGIDDVSLRAGWNSPAQPELALPTETWREHVARRQRCLELREKLAGGEVASINDLVTLNLDVLQFAQDVIDNCEGPDLLRAIYYTIAGRLPQKSNEHFQRGISVLDPTCGSGAFLFAALNILQPLYEACLDRMAGFVEESEYAARATPEEELDELIAQGESKTLEFKSTARWDMKQGKANKDMEKVIVKTVAALLNSDGGDLVIGVDDAGAVVGLELDYGLMAKQGHRDGYENWLTTLLFQTNFGKQAAPFVSITFAQKEGKDICRVSAQPSPSAVYVKDGNDEHLFIRAGNSTRLLTAKEAIEYHKHRFDGAAPNVALSLRERKAGKPTKAPKRFNDFRAILASVDDHPSRTYFILKSIIINNLFGVDIMAEAVEICKLRLFLRLVSTIEQADQLEPLPDIDFNIRAGNTLVGYTTLEQVKKALAPKVGKNASSLGLVDEEDEALLAQIQEKAEIVDRNFKQFRLQQTQLGGAVSGNDKAGVRDALASLTDELNKYLAADYDKDPTKTRLYKKWLESHQPFHWFAEFYGTMSDGGFDVIIGNPPYVEYGEVKDDYTVLGYQTEPCANLYAFTWERCLAVVSGDGRVGMIVPVASVCTDGYAPLQQILLDRGKVVVSNFNDRPSKLFDGLEHIRLCVILHESSSQRSVHSTGYNKWQAVERPVLFDRLAFCDDSELNRIGALAKIGTPLERSILEKYAVESKSIADYVQANGAHRIYYTRKLSHFVQILDFVPEIRDSDDQLRTPSELKALAFAQSTHRDAYLALLNSTFFNWLITVFSDCRNLNKREIYASRLNLESMSPETAAALCVLARRLMENIQRTSEFVELNYKKHGKMTIQCTYPRLSKAIIDEIDGVLAAHYGLTAEELDFIVNFDIKYRMGIDEDDE